LAPSPRDLSSTQLWHESLERSQRRRELSELARKHQSRQKSASLAVTAAMATTPIAPTFKTFGGDGPQRASASHSRILEDRDDGTRILLERGMSSAAVVEVQQELKVAEDGIFGPITERAVKRYQAKHGLPPTGKVDVRTWLTLFPDGMVVYDPSNQSAQLAAQAPKQAVQGLAGANPAAPVSAASVGGPTGLAANGPAESDQDLRTARNQARDGGAPESAEADGGILPDRDAERSERKQRKRERRGSGHDRSANVTEGVTVDRGSRGGSSGGGGGNAGSRGGSSGGGGGGGGGPVGGPINVSPGLGSAQEMIAAMVAAANKIDRAHYSYRWGGGHNPSFSGPYDCSGAVSAVLHAAGLLNSPMVSGGFMRWGRPGPGAVTIYANAGHVYMSINGRFFGTTRANPGGGAGWFNGSRRAGFVVVHVPFEAMKFRKSTKRTVKSASTTRTQTRAATASQEPSSSKASGSRDAQSGGATYQSTAPAEGGTTAEAQAAPEQGTAPAPAPEAAPAEAAPAAAAPAQAAPAPAAAPAEAAPAQAAAPEAAPAAAAPAPAAAPAEAAPAAPAEAEPAAAAPAPAAPAAPAPAAEAPAPAAEAPAAPAPEAAAPAPAAPEAAAPAEAPAPEAPAADPAPEAAAPADSTTDAAGSATESKDGSQDEQSGSAATSG
jgi:peptidoglycan hydrolase-like protein with peptidoglycan-binding domain